MIRRLHASLLAACILSSAHAWAAPVSPATTATAAATTAPVNARVAWFQKRLVQIRAAIAALPADTTRTVVMLGDSITEGFRMTEVAGWRVVNEGISSDHIHVDKGIGGVTSRLDLVAEARPAHVFLMIGINDFGSSKSLDTAERQYRMLVAKLKAAVPDATIHLETLIPTRGRFSFHNPTVNEMNRRIERIAGEYGCDFVDIHKLVRDGKGELRADFTRDGLHLKAPAYEEWKKEIAARLQAR